MLIETEVSSKWINYNILFSSSIWQWFPFQNSQLWFCLQILYKLCNRPITVSPIHCLFEGIGRQLCDCGGHSSVEPGGGVSIPCHCLRPSGQAYLSESRIKFLNMANEWCTPNDSGSQSFQFWDLNLLESIGQKKLNVAHVYQCGCMEIVTSFLVRLKFLFKLITVSCNVCCYESCLQTAAEFHTCCQGAFILSSLWMTYFRANTLLASTSQLQNNPVPLDILRLISTIFFPFCKPK